MKKRLLAFTIFLTMAFSLTAGAASFTDITATSHPWAYEAVNKMTQEGIINGTSATTFTPDSAVTRIQALLLISRILGYNSAAVKENINSITSLYSDELKSLSTTYKKELSFLIFMNVFTADDFVNMNLDEEVSREEAALFLAKADGINADAIDDLESYDNAFSDDGEISLEFKPFVYYVRDKGYMTGVGEGLFSPKTKVTRAQIATMLFRVLPNVSYTLTKANVDSVSADDNTAKVFVATKTYDLPKNAVIRNNGEKIEPKNLYTGLYGFVKMTKDGEIEQFDVFFDAPVVTKTVDGLISHVGTKTGVIQIKDIDTNVTENYDLLENRYKIVINGSEGELSQLRTNDYVVLGLDKADRIITITVSDTSEELTDLIIEKIDITASETTLVLKDAKDKEYTFTMTDAEPVIRKNGNVVSLSALSEGDKISKLQLLYNRIKSIDTYSEVTSTKGTITTIHISEESYIVITSGGKDSTFNLNKDTSYYVYGESKTIYGLQLGQNVSITLDGKNVSKVEATIASQTTDVKGTVEAVNTSAGFITVNTGEDLVIVYVSTKANNATKIIDNDAAMATNKTLKNIEKGASITALGAMVNGVFEATTIVYSNK